jgi:hypothetical protein
MHVSGQPATVIINSIANSLLMRYVFGVGRRLGVLPMDTFREHVALMTYGDDNVMGVGPDVRGVWTFAFLNRELARVGITYTPADKSDATKAPMRVLKEIDFLKRAWVPADFRGRYLAPLAMASIEKMLRCWVQSTSVSEELQLISVIESARLELLAHGRYEYERFVRAIPQLLQPLGYYESYALFVAKKDLSYEAAFFDAYDCRHPVE